MLNALTMHFKCVDNALQCVDNGFERICNVICSIIKTLKMFNEIVSEWVKNVSQRVDSFFQRLIQMLHKVLKTKDNVSPCCNKDKHIGNTTNST